MRHRLFVVAAGLVSALALSLDAQQPEPQNDSRYVERLDEGGLHTDFDVVEIDEERDFQACLCQGVLRMVGLVVRGASASGRSGAPGP